MSARHLLRELRTKGIAYRLGSAPDKLWLGPREKVAPDLLHHVLAHKEDILTILRSEQFDWTDLEERAAQIGCDRPRSMTLAYEAVIGTPDDVVNRWNYLISRMKPQTELSDWLKDEAMTFLTTKWPTAAAEIGWSEVEVWGVHPLSARTRIDCHGLFMTAASWPDRSIQIAQLNQGHAVLTTKQNPEIAVPRTIFASEAIPVWKALTVQPGAIN